MQTCPLPHGNKPLLKKDPHVNLPLTLSPPTTMAPTTRFDMSTPTNAHYPPSSDNSRYIHADPSLQEPIHADFHDFHANGQFSGLSHMSSASTGSQPGSTPAFDPNLKCHGCDRQFREGEIQVFRRHSSTCEKLQQLLRQVSLEEVEYPEEEEEEFDPNLTCIGCGQAFRQRQIQNYKKHTQSCSMYQTRLRSKSESNDRKKEGDEISADTGERNRSNTCT